MFYHDPLRVQKTACILPKQISGSEIAKESASLTEFMLTSQTFQLAVVRTRFTGVRKEFYIWSNETRRHLFLLPSSLSTI